MNFLQEFVFHSRLAEAEGTGESSAEREKILLEEIEEAKV